MTNSSQNNAENNSYDWCFDPIKAERVMMDFADFEQTDYAKQAIANIEATPIGARLVAFIRDLNPLIAYEEMPVYSLYVPYEHNLEPWRTSGTEVYEEDQPLIVLDKKDIEQRFLPYILANQFFRVMQDYAEDEMGSRVLPMFQHSVVYNPSVLITEERDFVNEYAASERACDVVALCVAFQMSRMGLDKHLFGTMLQQKYTEQMCLWITQTGHFIEDLGIGHQDPGMAEDLLLYMGNFGGLSDSAYMTSLKDKGAFVFRTTLNNPGFQGLDVQTELEQPPFNAFNFGVLSHTYDERQWDVNEWVQAINTHIAEEKKIRAFTLSEAFKMADENAKEAWLDGADLPNQETPKKPKAGKKAKKKKSKKNQPK